MVDNRIKLGHRLGQGAFAQTFKAEVIDRHLAKKWQKIVAVKVPLSDETQDDVINDVVNMARIQGVLSCFPDDAAHHLVRFFGCERYRDHNARESYVMVSEFIDGVDLRKKIGPPGSSKALSTIEAINCVLQVCDALSVLHRAGIFHRDLKPANILIQEKKEGMRVWVADFGMSTILDRGAEEISNSTWGAIAYTPPELMIDPRTPITAACDLYSLGLILYELCCGGLPYYRLDNVGVVEEGRELDRAFRHPHELSLQVPGPLCEVIIKAIAKRREERYQSAEEMAEDLLKARTAIQEIASAAVETPPAVSRELATIMTKLDQKPPGTVDTEVLAAVERELSKLAGRYPSQPEVFLNLGLFYRRWAGDMVKAQEVYELGLENTPYSSILLYQLGQALLSQPNLGAETQERAVNRLKKALQYGLTDRDQIRKAERLVRANTER